MFTKELGKISSVELVLGGRDEDTLGISFSFSGTGWGVCDFWTFERARTHLPEILNAALVKNLSQLKGKPVEITLKSNTINAWRILTEVL